MEEWFAEPNTKASELWLTPQTEISLNQFCTHVFNAFAKMPCFSFKKRRTFSKSFHQRGLLSKKRWINLEHEQDSDEKDMKKVLKFTFETGKRFISCRDWSHWAAVRSFWTFFVCTFSLFFRGIFLMRGLTGIREGSYYSSSHSNAYGSRCTP